jgi:hypothetical protein
MELPRTSLVYNPRMDARVRVSPRVRQLALIGLLLAGIGLVVIGLMEPDEPAVADVGPAAHPSHGGTPPPPRQQQWQPGNMFNPPRVYEGPDGPKTLPLDRAFIANVWLQGCHDCMPSFEAWRKLYESGEIPKALPIVNIAYGNVEPAWAERYRLRDTLLVDGDGQKLVRPQLITTFTTLVVTAERKIVWRGHPRDSGYLDGLKSALAALPKD